MNRIHSLDILRSAAILWVVGAHAPFFSDGSIAKKFFGWGSLGVNLFFVLSGYLIATQWFQELHRNNGKGSYWNFFLRRAFRIWPNYFILLIFFTILYGNSERSPQPVWIYLLFLQNFVETKGFEVTWSLCIEEHFYLVFPLLSLFSFHKSSKFNLGIFVSLICLGVGIRLALWLFVRPDSIHLISPKDAERAFYLYFYHPTFTRLDGMIFGVGIATLRQFRPVLWTRLMNLGNLWTALSAVFFVTTVAIGSGTLGRLLPPVLLTPGAPSGLGALPIGFSTLGFDFSFACLMMGALSPHSFFHKLRLPFANRIAILSFAMYLTHSDVIYFLEKAVVEFNLPATGWIPMTLVWFSSFLAAWILYSLVERPFLKMRDRFISRQPIPEEKLGYSG